MTVSDSISGEALKLWELFDNAIYRIDYYQREYAWSSDDVKILISDLFDQFEPVWESRRLIRRGTAPEPFFLGPIVFFEEDKGVRFLVDGQQRLTTLHLIFIHLYRIARSYSKRDLLERLSRVIFGFDSAGKRGNFRVDIMENRKALNSLYDRRPYELPLGASLSLRNLWDRSNQIGELLRSKLTGESLPQFVDWVLRYVVFIGIRTSSRDSGYRIFESMNDRGARLSSVDLVKSFLLSNVGRDEEKLNIEWRKMLSEITRVRGDVDAPKKFLKAALIGRYADLATADGRDADEIDASLNIWVRKNHQQRLGLSKPEHYFTLVDDLIETSKHYVMFLNASTTFYLENGLEALYYNEVNGIANQMELVLAAVRPQDTMSEAKEKAKLAASFLDRLFVVRALAEEPVEAKDFKADIHRLIPRLRLCKTVEDVANTLAGEIEAETFESVRTFGLRGNNKAAVRYILARLTAYTEIGCSKPDLSNDYLAIERTWHIEHLWPNHYEWYQDQVPDAVTFRLLRARLSGLGLLQYRDNTSLNDLPLAEKIKHYGRQPNLLAVLSPGHRKRNPAARDFAKNNDVEAYFRDFGDKPQLEAVLAGRAQLMQRLCVRVWDPKTLGFGAAKAERDLETPLPEAITRTIASSLRRKLQTDVAKMVRNGVLMPASTIVLTHEGKDHTATVDDGGYVHFSTGDVFSKLDEAGRMITEKACDGLGEWSVVLASGERISLRTLKNRQNLKVSA